MLGWFQAFGGQIGPDSDGRYTFNTPAIIQAFTFLKGLENQNCAWVGRDATPYDYFINREALFYLGTLDDLPEQRDAMHKVSHADQWTVIPFPVVEGKPLVVADDINFYLVKSSPARQMAAWLFIRWMESSEQQARWMQLSNTVPLGISVQAILGGFRSENPQWAAAFDLVSLARPQPSQASWALVSGVLGDGAQQILQPGTPLDDISTILAQIDQTAAELMIRKAP
jgi:ABC-type glycerol-3-phosphate transport system substrate-binding protein